MALISGFNSAAARARPPPSGKPPLHPGTLKKPAAEPAPKGTRSKQKAAAPQQAKRPCGASGFNPTELSDSSNDGQLKTEASPIPWSPIDSDRGSDGFSSSDGDDSDGEGEKLGAREGIRHMEALLELRRKDEGGEGEGPPMRKPGQFSFLQPISFNPLMDILFLQPISCKNCDANLLVCYICL